MDFFKQDLIGFIGNAIVAILLLLLVYSIIVSAQEKEKRAAIRLFFVFLALAVFGIILNLITGFLPAALVWGVFVSLFFLIVIILLAPWPEKALDVDFSKEEKIDERTIMFSRSELKPDTQNYEAYYANHPEHLEADNKWRDSHGLLDEKSLFYNPYLFAAADASFYAVSGLHAKTDGQVAEKIADLNTKEFTRFVKNWGKEMGCHSIGITQLQDSHLYSYGGRRHNYNEKVVNKHPVAIAFTVEMSFDRVAAAPRAPIIQESASQYLNSGIIAVQLAAFLRNLGYSARAHIDGKYQVRCPQVARDAGLGQLGRMGILMTPKLGPRVRIGVVTTNAPLEIVENKVDNSVIRFCQICKKCADTCPAQAISFDDRKVRNGSLQWNIKQEECFSYWCKVGTDCGRCVATCPYSHPNNLLHNTIRLCIRRSPLFRQLAYRLDDWLYGRKPPSRELPDWMNAKN